MARRRRRPDRRRCCALTRCGKTCKRLATPNSDHCWQHTVMYGPNSQRRPVGQAPAGPPAPPAPAGPPPPAPAGPPAPLVAPLVAPAPPAPAGPPAPQAAPASPASSSPPSPAPSSPAPPSPPAPSPPSPPAPSPLAPAATAPAPAAPTAPAPAPSGARGPARQFVVLKDKEPHWVPEKQALPPPNIPAPTAEKAEKLKSWPPTALTNHWGLSVARNGARFDRLKQIVGGTIHRQRIEPEVTAYRIVPRKRPAPEGTENEPVPKVAKSGASLEERSPRKRLFSGDTSDQPAQKVARGKGPVPGSSKGKGPASGSSKGKGPVPGSSKGKGPVPGSSKGKGPASGSSKRQAPMPLDMSGPSKRARTAEADLDLEGEEAVTHLRLQIARHTELRSLQLADLDLEGEEAVAALRRQIALIAEETDPLILDIKADERELKRTGELKVNQWISTATLTENSREDCMWEKVVNISQKKTTFSHYFNLKNKIHHPLSPRLTNVNRRRKRVVVRRRRRLTQVRQEVLIPKGCKCNFCVCHRDKISRSRQIATQTRETVERMPEIDIYRRP